MKPGTYRPPTVPNSAELEERRWALIEHLKEQLGPEPAAQLSEVLNPKALKRAASRTDRRRARGLS